MEFTPALAESSGVPPVLSPVAGKSVIVGFDGGRLTSADQLPLPGKLPDAGRSHHQAAALNAALSAGATCRRATHPRNQKRIAERMVDVHHSDSADRTRY